MSGVDPDDLRTLMLDRSNFQKKWGDLSTTPEGALSNTYRGEPRFAGTYPLTIPPREVGRSASIQVNYRKCRASFTGGQIFLLRGAGRTKWLGGLMGVCRRITTQLAAFC